MNDIEILLHKNLVKLTFIQKRIEEMVLTQQDLTATAELIGTETTRLKDLVIALRQEIVLLQEQLANTPTKEVFDGIYTPKVEGLQEIQ